MSVNLSLLGGAGWQFFTDNGTPLAGGLLYTYLAGTSTAATTYTTSAGNVPNSNPIVLNSAGRVQTEIWLTQGVSYKFVLKTSAFITIGTYDNIDGAADPADIYAALAASSGSSLVGFIQSGSGAVATTVQAKLRESVSVKDFGADSTGVADSTTAIQAAFNSGNSVYFPSGTYKITQTITQSTPAYSNGAIIDVAISNAVTYPFAFNSGANISGLVFNGTNSVTGVSAILMTASGKLTENCQFSTFFGYAYRSPSGVTNNTLSQCIVNLCGRGTGGTNIEAVYVHTGCIVDSCQVTNSRYKAIISGTAADNVRFVNNVVDTTTNVSEGLYFSENTTDSVMMGNRVRGIEVGVASIKLTRGATRCQVISNYAEINGILSQGGTDNFIAYNNVIGAISITAHDNGSTILAETGTQILSNSVSDYIQLGAIDLGDVNGIICKGNTCGGNITTTGVSLYSSFIDSNKCAKINLTIDPSETTASIGPLTITNNTIVFTTGVGLLARGVDTGAGLQAPQVVITNNYVRGPGAATASTVGIKSLGVVLTTIENNVIEQSETGLEVSRLGTTPRLRIRDNSANADVTTGYSFPDSDSAVYWSGSDFVIENNIGTYTAVASSRPFFYPSQKNLYAAAAPTTGYHQVGEYRINSAPTSGGSWGFVCTTAGTPGTWKTYGTIS